MLLCTVKQVLCSIPEVDAQGWVKLYLFELKKPAPSLTALQCSGSTKRLESHLNQLCGDSPMVRGTARWHWDTHQHHLYSSKHREHGQWKGMWPESWCALQFSNDLQKGLLEATAARYNLEQLWGYSNLNWGPNWPSSNPRTRRCTCYHVAIFTTLILQLHCLQPEYNWGSDPVAMHAVKLVIFVISLS